MKLPISFLLEYLEKDIRIIGDIQEHVEYLVQRPVFWTTETVLESGCLYLTDQRIPENCQIEKGAFVIGVEDDGVLGCLKPGKSIFALSNRIHQLFDQVEKWFFRMKRCGEQNGTLGDILAIGGEYLKHYIAVMDPDFLILERYLGDAMSSADIHDETGYLKMDVVNALKLDPGYDAVENYKEAFLYGSKELKTRFWCVNLQEDGAYRGRINMREEEEETFKPWEGFFLECLRDAILPVFLRTSKHKQHTMRQRSFVQLLLEGKENYQNELYLFLQDTGWPEHGSYVCACLKMGEEDAFTPDASDYYSKEIEFLLKDTVCVAFECRIFLLHCIRGSMEEQELLAKLNYFVRESNFRMGVSRRFSDIRKACYARSQAQIALDFGRMYQEWQWKTEFDEVALLYLKRCCLGELPPEWVGHRAFLTLKEQDERTGSSLCETLRCFVKMDFNGVHTAQALFIHRGTLLYRLGRIQELTGVQWASWKDKMYLALSVLLLEEDLFTPV